MEILAIPRVPGKYADEMLRIVVEGKLVIDDKVSDKKVIAYIDVPIPKENIIPCWTK